ncbi:accessory gland protein Acp29AB, partial [Biomphalaria glabrata]
WLGVSDLDQEGHYVRSSDHTTFFTALWGRDQPDNIYHPVYSDDEDCLTLKTVAISEKYITDDECIFNRLYVCQS